MDKINEIFGEVSPGFERVRMEFQNNFKDRKELGAACTIYHISQEDSLLKTLLRLGGR